MLDVDAGFIDLAADRCRIIFRRNQYQIGGKCISAEHLCCRDVHTARKTARNRSKPSVSRACMPSVQHSAFSEQPERLNGCKP